MRAAGLVLILFTLAGCGSHEPPMATGPWRQMNVGKWSFNENALTSPPPGLAR